MNNRKNKKIIFISFIMLLTTIICGCKSNKEELNIELNKGSVAILKEGNYEIFNLIDGIYEKLSTDYIITSYDSKSKNFIFNRDGEFNVYYCGEERSIDENNEIYYPDLSPGGNYISYFTKDSYLKLNVKDIKENKNILIESDVAISGSLVKWYNEEMLVYYGVDSNKNNGIFIYNINSNEEQLIYKLDSGYIEYLEVLDDGVVFIQEKEGKQKTLKFINQYYEETEAIENIVDVSDVEYTKDGIYIIGKMEDNNYSLYCYNDGNIKRLVYDFPKIIDLDKGLSIDSNGNILFIGGNEPRVERVYICEAGAVSELSNEEGEYFFIEYK